MKILKKLTLILMLATFASPIHAQKSTAKPACTKGSPPVPTPKPTPTPAPVTSNSNSSTASSTSSSNSASASTSNATGGNAASTATGGTSNAQGGTSSASNGGNSQTSISTDVRQAPAAIAPEAFSTAPCRIAGSIGGSAPIGGLSLGGSKADHDCNLFHLAAFYSSIGRNDLALQVLCNMKLSKGLAGCGPLPVPVAPVLPQTRPIVPMVTPDTAITAEQTQLGPLATCSGRLNNECKAELDSAILTYKQAGGSLIVVSSVHQQKLAYGIRAYLLANGVTSVTTSLSENGPIDVQVNFTE